MTNPLLTFKGRPAPLWCWLLLGWLLAFTASRLIASAPLEDALAERPPLDPVSPTLMESTRPRAQVVPLARWPAFDPEWTFEAMSPRQMRALPEIGPKRAVQIAETRWQQGLTAAPRAFNAPDTAQLDLTSVPGIGPQTERVARKAALSRRLRAPRDPIPPPPHLP